MARISQDQAQERHAFLLDLFRNQPDISRNEAMDAYKDKFGASLNAKTFNELREQALRDAENEEKAEENVSEAEETPVEETRVKGLEPRLTVHRQRAGEAEPLADGALAASGDVVQLAYVAAGRAHGVILSVDGRGTVTLHAPESGTGSVPLAPAGTHALPGAYALDDAPGFERFFLVTAEAPFSLEEVLAAARSLAGHAEARTSPLPLPSRYMQASFTLEKSSP